MNYRQVHLDFHTSEKIGGIGEEFDKAQFQEALKIGHIDSITVFSKCHHGWSYHPTKVNQMHPNLKFDLLKAQIEAAHEIGVKAVGYISAGYDEKFAVQHKDCTIRNIDGTMNFVKTFDEPGFHWLCFNTPYLDVLLSQIRELLENYDIDGLFLDIIHIWPCYCEHCKKQLIAEGKDPANLKDVIDLAERTYAHYAKCVKDLVDEIKPGITVFHNCGHVTQGRRDMVFDNTHLELESLPTGGWGYDHFPVSAAYARTLGVEFLGMTGKFHTSWGEFGGFKHPNALRYEAALSISNGAGCSIGDQLHPNGKMDIATYSLIGKAYEDVEKKEEYLKNSVNIADIAVLSSEAVENYFYNYEESKEFSSSVGIANTGAARILLEGKYLFNYIDLEEDFSKYKLIIMPDVEAVDDYIKEKVVKFVKNGGKILASGKSATDENGKFIVDFGCEFDGENIYQPSYIRPCFELDSLQNSAFVVYSKGYKLKSIKGEVLTNTENPYFNRSIEHFCSHQQTPNNFDDSFPSTVMGQNGIYIGFDIFTEYAEQGSITIKEIVCKLIDRLLPDKSIITDLPAQGVVTLTEQKNRKIVHLLYASPVKRGNGVEIIEDIVPLFNINVSVLCDKPKNIYLAPQGVPVDFTYENGYVKFKVEKLDCHQMIALEC